VGARSKAQAIDRFCSLFKESLSCLTSQFLHPVQKSANVYVLTYEPPAELLCEKARRAISVTQVFSAVTDRQGEFKVRTREYSYSLLEQQLNASIEVVSYHWHPECTAVRFPHLHIASIPRVHFPTARVSVESLLRMLIDYYDIEPILRESEWRAILKRNNAAFDKAATWK
jgi:hypothetical protein